MDWSALEPYLKKSLAGHPDFFKCALVFADGTRYNTAGATPAGEYEPDENASNSLTSETDVNTEIVPPPIEDLELLLDLVRRGRIRQIRQEVERIVRYFSSSS